MNPTIGKKRTRIGNFIQKVFFLNTKNKPGYDNTLKIWQQNEKC